MYLARIDGTAMGVARHSTMNGCRFLVARRLEPNGSLAAEPILVVDWMGAGKGSTVVVSTDGDIARKKFGNTTPIRLTVLGIVDAVQTPANPEGRVE